MSVPCLSSLREHSSSLIQSQAGVHLPAGWALLGGIGRHKNKQQKGLASPAWSGFPPLGPWEDTFPSPGCWEMEGDIFPAAWLGVDSPTATRKQSLTHQRQQRKHTAPCAQAS